MAHSESLPAPTTHLADMGAAPPPRISGTAVVGGVHLSTGNYGTVGPVRLFLTGLYITGMLAIGLGMTMIEVELLGRLPIPGMVGLEMAAVLSQAILPIFAFANFLILMRLSPLSGYHAAEHKVVMAIERYGYLEWDLVVAMPRAHPRCGTVLLLGVLPGLLIAYPLFVTQPLAAVAVAVAGWLLRYRLGYFIQQNFTTKAPTPAQLQAGMESGLRILELWRSEPWRRVTLARNVWTRGLPQMLVGVIIGQQLLFWVTANLHLWLDW